MTRLPSSRGKERFMNAYRRRFELDNGTGPSWLAELRRAAIEKFGELGFPTTRHEDWKYTNVEPIAALDFDSPRQNGVEIPTASLLQFSMAAGARHRLVFVNGHYSEKHSATGNLPAGVRILRLSELLGGNDAEGAAWFAGQVEMQERPFAALNTAFMEDGAVIFIPRNCRMEEPIYSIFVSSGSVTPFACHPRNLFACGEGSDVKIVESYVGLGSGAYFSNPVTKITAAANSVIDHYRLQSELPGSFHVGLLGVRLERQAIFSSHSITLAGGLVRNDVHALLDGEGAECNLNGLYISDGEQHIDNHTEIVHAQPRAVSHELYKGILGGRSHGVFNGKILVRKAAQKSDARQTNKNLLLSKDAVINSKPQLEIYADDVKCSHGSTIGQLDRDALFYLRSRGIGAEDSRALLSYAFAADILSRVKIAPLRICLEESLLTKFTETAGQ